MSRTISSRLSVEMPVSTPDTRDIISLVSTGARHQLRAWVKCATAPRILATIVFIYGVGVALLYKPFSQQEGGDAAIWDYLAQCILRGQVLYRDVIEIKGPASAYLSALAMLVGKSLGLRDVLAVRLMQSAAVGALLSITYLITERLLHSKLAAMLASFVPLVSDYFVGWMGQGTQPKLWMILFGLLSLLFIAKGRPFWAGCFSMLSCLCWQPGLLFTGVAFLVFSRYMTRWRDFNGARVVAGAAIPLFGVIVYFYMAGALHDLWMWTIVYDAEVYAPEGARGLGESLAVLWGVIHRVFGARSFFTTIGLAGMLALGVEVLYGKVKRVPQPASEAYLEEAVLIASAAYIVFCFVDFQSGPDLIPLFPFVGVFTAYLIAKACKLASAHVPSMLSRTQLNLASVTVGSALAIILVLVLYSPMRFNMAPAEGLSYQEEHLKPVADMLGPGDKVYINGAVEILVLLHRPNLISSVMWDKGKDEFLASMKYGGSFEEIIRDIEAQKPKLVALNRLAHVKHKAELERWAAEHYEKKQIGDYHLYVRNEDR